MMVAHQRRKNNVWQVSILVPCTGQKQKREKRHPTMEAILKVWAEKKHYILHNKFQLDLCMSADHNSWLTIVRDSGGH